MVRYVYRNKTVNSVDLKDSKYIIFPAPDTSSVNENQHFNLQLSLTILKTLLNFHLLYFL